MKTYVVTEKQLDDLKKYIEKLHELAGELSEDVAFTRPDIRSEELSDIIDSYFPYSERGHRGPFAKEIEELANDAIASAAEAFDETAVTALRESAEALERELGFLVEDVERQEAAESGAEKELAAGRFNK